MKKKNDKITEVPLNRADEYTRRKFIKHATYFLGIMGVPWVRKFEIIEKVSKNLLGSSVAYAQSPGRLIYPIVFYVRAGYQASELLAVSQDLTTADSTYLGDRNYFESQDVLIANQIPAATTGLANLYPAAPFKAFLDTISVTNAYEIRNRTIGLNNFRNSNGHQANGSAIVNGASVMAAFSHAMAARGFEFTTGPIAIGSKNTGDASATGSAGVEHSPQYFSSVQAARDIVSSFKLRFDGTQYSDTTRDQVLDVITRSNASVIEALAETKTGPAISSGMDKLNKLLTTDQSAALAANNGIETTYNTGVTIPGNMSFSNDDNWGRLIYFYERAVLNNFTSGLFIPVSGPDWHGIGANMGTTAGNTGTGTDQLEWAQAFSAMLTNLYARWLTIDDPNNPGMKLADNVCVFFASEFRRSIMNKALANNNDGQSNGGNLIAPFGMVKGGGTLGDLAADGSLRPPDPASPDGTGVTSNPNSVMDSVIINTALSCMGLTQAEREAAGVMGDIIKVATGT